MKKEKIFIAVAAVVLIALVISTGIFYDHNVSLTKNLKDERSKTELMSSQKVTLQNEIADFKNQIKSLNGKNTELDKMLSQTSRQLSEKETAMNKIVRENGNINALKKQLADVTQMKKDFENQVHSMTASIQKLNSEKDAMNQTITLLRDENKQLAANLDILSSMTADNYLVQTTKRKDKLTVIARRAKKMSLSFKVPENMVENISFKLTKPDGTKVEGKDQGIAYTVVNDGDGLTASTSPAQVIVSKKIEMNYVPKEKLKSGVYKIEMYNGQKYIGCCNVKLR